METVTPSRGQVPEVAPEVVLRPGRETDIDYVYATWLRSYLQLGVTLGWVRQGGPEAKARYYRGQQALIASLLKRSTLTIAGLKGDDATVCGWVVHSRPGPEVEGRHLVYVLHYLYVRRTLQRCGVGWKLLQHVNPTVYTHLNRSPGADRRDWLQDWLKKDAPRATYDPYAVF